MNWLGSSTASQSTWLMPATGPASSVVSMCCSACPNSWNSVVTSECVISDGFEPTGRAVAHHVRGGEAHRVPGRRHRGGPLDDDVVHPRAAALLARARVRVEVVRAGARRLFLSVTAKNRTSGCRDLDVAVGGSDVDVEELPRQREHPLDHRGELEVRPQVLLLELVLGLAEALRPETPRPTASGPSPPRARPPSRRTRADLPRARAPPRAETSRGCFPGAPPRIRASPSSSPSKPPRTCRIREARLLAPKRQNLLDERRVIRLLGRKLRRPREARAVARLAQRARFLACDRTAMYEGASSVNIHGPSSAVAPSRPPRVAAVCAASSSAERGETVHLLLRLAQVLERLGRVQDVVAERGR